MQHALKQRRSLRRDYLPTKPHIKRGGQSSSRLNGDSPQKKSVKSSNRARLIFQIAMLIAFVCSSIALTRVVQYAFYNQYALQNEQLKQNIAAQEQINQELASRRLSLESPQRIESIAMAKLKMIKPDSIRYIVFNEPQGNSQLAFAKK